MQYTAMRQDLEPEAARIEVFLSPQMYNMQDYQLALLDQTLQYRNVNVPSDEPLCIGTPLSLDMEKILAVPKTR